MTYTTKQQYLDKVAELRVELLTVKTTDLQRASEISLTIMRLMAEALRQFKTN